MRRFPLTLSRARARFLAVVVGLFVSLPWVAMAQDSPKSVDIFLEDEQLDVEADIPSVDLVLSFKGLRYENIDPKKTFLPELYRTLEEAPV